MARYNAKYTTEEERIAARRLAQKKYRDDNREKVLLWKKNNYHRFKERVRETARRHRLKKVNFTVEQYEEMYATQNGLCAICQKPEPSGRRLAVDHDHKTGTVRELLCLRCNTLLGRCDDAIDTLEKAVVYLRKHRDATSV